MQLKIGQIVTISEDFEIETSLGDNKLQVKKGDTGFIDRRGFIHYMRGKARGKMHKFEDVEVNGYDHESIATLIVKRLNNEYGLIDMLEDNDIEQQEFINAIEDMLSDIM